MKKATFTEQGMSCITCKHARNFAPNPDSSICDRCARCSQYQGKRVQQKSVAAELVETGKLIDEHIANAIRKDFPFCTRTEGNRHMCFAFDYGRCTLTLGTCELQEELAEQYQKEADSIAAEAERNWRKNSCESITVEEGGKDFSIMEATDAREAAQKEETPEMINGFPNPLFIHDVLIKAAREIMMKKNHDYTSGSGDPYANFRGSTQLGISNIKGILLRVQDKLMRIRTFDEKGKLKVKDESVQDALIDVINYMVLIGGLVKETQDGN